MLHPLPESFDSERTSNTELTSHDPDSFDHPRFPLTTRYHDLIDMMSVWYKVFPLLLLLLIGNVAAKNWRDERVISAQRVERPNTSGGVSPDLYHHEGIKVKFESGREMLLHNDKKAGVVATDASGLSSKWTGRDIPVNHKTTGQNLMNVMSSSRSTKVAGPTGWVASGTCMGSAGRAERALTKGTNFLGLPK